MKKLFIIVLLFVYAGALYAQSEAHAVRLSSAAKVSNTIIYQNHQLRPIIQLFGVSYSASDSLLQGEGNIRLMGSPFSVGHRINSSSPAYNKGSLAVLAAGDSLDLDFRPRVSCQQVDIGAYEVDMLTTQITLEPLPQHVCEGTAMVLRAEAVGQSITYQWQRNGQKLLGKVSATLALSGALSDTGSYRVIAMGDCCNDTSAWVRVDVDAQPAVVAMNDTTVLSEADVALRVLSAVGNVHWLESDNTTLVLDTMIRNIRQTVQYIAVATNGLCSVEARDLVTIAVNGTPCWVKAKADTTICAGESYRLLVESATVDYKWYVLGASAALPAFAVVRPIDTLHLAVVGSNSQGETCADTLMVAVRKVALKAMDNRAVCSGSEVELTSVPVADAWYTQDGTLLGAGNHVKVYPPMNATTLYIAHRSDGVCTASDTVSIYANPPNLQASFVDTLLCEGDYVYLQTNVDPSMVIWKRQSTGEDMGFDPLFQALQSDLYQAWAYDALCGDIFVEVRVRVQAKPAFSVLGPHTACEQSPVWLSSAPNAAYWRLLDGTRVSNPLVPTQSQAYVGVYTEGVCTAIDTLWLQVDERPAFVACADTSIRSGHSVTLWSTPTASYWQVLGSVDALSSLQVSPQDTTFYLASLETAACGVLRDTVAVFVNQQDTFSLTLSYDNGCSPGTGWAKVSVLGDQQQNTTYSYLWSTGSQDSLIEGLSAGAYTVTVSNSRGVQVVGRLALLNEPFLQVDVALEEPNNEQCSGGAIRVSVTGGTPGYDYLWSHGAVSKDLINISSGVYHLTVTDSKGCELTQEVRLSCRYKRLMPTLFITPNGDGKNDYLDIKYILLYPNNTVTILNAYGDEIVKLTNYDNQTVIWDGRNRRGEKIPDGVYYYIIEAEGVDSMAGWIMMKLSKSN